MFKTLKKTIFNAAREAVYECERMFSSDAGRVKKAAAVSFVTEALPLPAFLKPLAAKLLAAFIDECIETAVTLMKSA